MFKDMFAFLGADYDEPRTDFEKKFFDNIEKFAFYDELNAACVKNEGKDIAALVAAGNYKAVVANMLESRGLNYGQLPKGLLLFHRYEDGVRTPLEEHLVEGALYASSAGEANVHFTVSHEHKALFEKKVAEKKDKYVAKFGINYNISFLSRSPAPTLLPPTRTTLRSAMPTALCCSVPEVMVLSSRILTTSTPT